MSMRTFESSSISKIRGTPGIQSILSGTSTASLLDRSAGATGHRNRGGRAGLQPQHVFHSVKSGRLVLEPERGPHRPLGIDRAVGRAVHQFDAFAGAGEDHMMVADRIAAAKRRETDCPRAARPGAAAPP